MFNGMQDITILALIIWTSFIKCSYSYVLVEHCPGTYVHNIKHQTEFREISLIMYYTQWSDGNLEALQQFNDVAAYFKDKVYFAAVDCWHLSCNCSNTLSTAVGSGSPHKWPTLIAHYGRIRQFKIQYNGLFLFRDMVQFIANIMHPLERMERKDTLENMKSLTDAIVVGYFENASTFEYQYYLIAALKWLERDPIRTYRFIVEFIDTKENLNTIKEERKTNIILFTHNNTKSFADYNDFKWNASNILRWLHEELNDYNLLYGYSSPITITQKMRKQPVMAIFVHEPQKFFSYMEKYVDKKQSFTKTSLECKRSEKMRAKTKLEKSPKFFDITQKLKYLSDESNCYYYIKDVILKNLNLYYELDKYFKTYQGNSSLAHSILRYRVNSEVFELLNFFEATTCLKNEDITLQPFLQISMVKKLEGYLENEQQCKSSNRSLAVVVLNEQRYKDFLENLYISPTYKSMATVFIVDNENENIYIMEDRFAMYNLMEFVKKFYSNGLNNYYKNEAYTPAKVAPSYFSTRAAKYDVELPELNRVLLLNYLQHVHNQTLIVLIYSPDCALCGNIQHSFLQLSLSLRHIRELKFIRINAMENDLPWHLNMAFLPALIVFPENRFSESRLFPTHLKPDVRNVFGFILSQLSAQQQIKFVLAMCQSGTLSQNNAQSCWQFAKTILMQHIGKHLHYWEIFEAERNVIFQRLRAFKHTSLEIQRNESL